jgi:hypothetical protein
VFHLHQRDLPRSAVTMIADQAAVRIEIGPRNRHKRLPPRRTKADPGDLAGTHRRGEQAGEGAIRAQQVGISDGPPMCNGRNVSAGSQRR